MLSSRHASRRARSARAPRRVLPWRRALSSRLTLPLSLDEAVLGGRVLCDLPAFLRHPLRLEQAQAILRQRLARREADFLALARHAIYRHPPSPYRALLRLAGCEYGDLARLVRQEGLEGALTALYRQGVYLTVEEFKGRRSAVRGSTRVEVAPRALRNPRLTAHLRGSSSGSRGAASAVPLHLAFIRERAVNALLTLDARGGAAWLKAVWADPAGALALTLRFSGFGAPAARAFTLVDLATPGLHARYRWSARALRWGSRLARVPLPDLEYAPLERPRAVARWMADALRRGQTPHLWCAVSPALRLCQAAREAGIALAGAQLTITGEPITAARLAALHQAGVGTLADYGSAESGFVGHGCLAAEAPDEVHVFEDLHALIQPGAAATPPLPPQGILVTSLRPAAPLILLNVSLGDQAVLGRRRCGCPLGRLGWRTHLHTIRSYEKLTAGGGALLDADAIRVLEELLPARFGGGPTDYQLVEEEAPDGQPRVRLRVHPRLGPLDAEAVRAAFLAGLGASVGAGSGAERVLAEQWGAGGLLRVERQAPRATASGKIHHLLQERHPAAAPPLH